jgi:hypothetical protein
MGELNAPSLSRQQQAGNRLETGSYTLTKVVSMQQ